MATIEIKNLDKLESKLNSLEKMKVDNVIKKVTTYVHGQAKNLAPVDTGNLRSSIHMNTYEENGKTIGKVYTNCEYAPYVEFGTGIKGNGSYPYNPEGVNLSYKEDWSGMVAQPYLYPALKDSEIYAKKLIEEEVLNNIKKITGGGS